MRAVLFRYYERLVLAHPRIWLSGFLILTGLAIYSAQDFRLDASADSLVLENDEDLAYFREISKRYGSSEFLIITYQPTTAPLFSRESLQHIDRLRQRIAAMPRVESVYTILDVPLLFSPKLSFRELAGGYRTLQDSEVDLQLARDEFTQTNPLYRGLLVNPEGNTTALLVNMARDETYYRLLNQRNSLRKAHRADELTEAGQDEYYRIKRTFSDYNSQTQERAAEEIAEIRRIMDDFRDDARLFLGGAPMIAVDIIGFIRSDLRVFGAGVALFLIVTLLVIFSRPRWIIIPLLCCATSVIWMTGFLGLMDWKVTVISSNFISLLLIITMSMTIHLIVRYRELHDRHPQASQAWLVRETISHMARPIVYTALTTMVAFSSLVFSGIRPVIDFGWMMTIGIGVSMLICLTLFPLALAPLRPLAPQKLRDTTRRATLSLANITAAHPGMVLMLTLGIALVALAGTSRLSVENRFIDYFQKDTEIYQGMLEIDQHLGGTTPLDIVLDAPAGFEPAGHKPPTGNAAGEDSFDDPFADPFDDPFADPFADSADNGDSSQPSHALEGSYWYTPERLKELLGIQHYLDSLPETGKVLSIASVYELATMLNGGPLSYVDLMLLSGFIPDNLHGQLVRPFLSEDGNQARIMLRMIDSDPNLNRNALLEKIREDLTGQFGLAAEQVHLTGAMVLYNNMLQSLFDSQIKTLGFVFVMILGMFVILFRSFFLALVAITPNLFSAAFILGLMGWVGLPLDLMTITIAAITIGIAVDDTIHYIHRFREEFPSDRDYLATMVRCHGSIGTAMYYTSLTIIAGFSILALSSFNPTVYFGLLTGLAMLVALLANLMVLPALLAVFKPRITPL